MAEVIMKLHEAIKAGHNAKVIGSSIEVTSKDGRKMGRLWYPRPTAARAGLRIAEMQAEKEQGE